MASADELIRAVDCAAAGDWETAHAIAQRHEGDAAADWLHAVLHKIEGDADNSRYWYGRVAHSSRSMPIRKPSSQRSAPAFPVNLGSRRQLPARRHGLKLSRTLMSRQD